MPRYLGVSFHLDLLCIADMHGNLVGNCCLRLLNILAHILGCAPCCCCSGKAGTL